MIFGFSGTKQTVRNTEVSVRRGYTVHVHNRYRKKEKRVISFMHEQNIIGSPTQLDDIGCT